jgi:hypothetical protein
MIVGRLRARALISPEKLVVVDPDHRHAQHHW